MKRYRVTVKHDNGTAEIITTAENMTAARQNVMASEGCPESAIISVWRDVRRAAPRRRSTGGRKSVAAFIAEHRAEIDAVILRRVPNARLTDSERRLWILNDEGLYQWARAEGVKI